MSIGGEFICKKCGEKVIDIANPQSLCSKCNPDMFDLKNETGSIRISVPELTEQLHKQGYEAILTCWWRCGRRGYKGHPGFDKEMSRIQVIEQLESIYQKLCNETTEEATALYLAIRKFKDDENYDDDGNAIS